MVSALDLLHLSQRAAACAAEYLRSVERPSDPAGWALKGSRDFVTRVDRTAERLIGDILLAAEPGSRMVGEEFSPDVVTGGLVWIVDPLDGTTNFLHGFPNMPCRLRHQSFVHGRPGLRVDRHRLSLQGGFPSG